MPLDDINVIANIFTLGACLDLCSSWSGCTAFSWNNLCDCWLKTNASVGNAGYESNTFSGYASLSQMTPLAPTLVCPFPKCSRQNASNGATFNVVCGSDFTGGDFGPQYVSSIPSYNTSGTIFSWHTDTYEECMNMCATSHPLCRTFTFSPRFAWTNCFLKNATGQTPSGMNTLPIYSGVLDETLKTSGGASACNNHATLTVQSADGHDIDFFRSCDDFRLPTQGTNGIITQIHEKDLDECVTACASIKSEISGDSCVAIVFDEKYQYGWDNCYLKSEIGPGLSQKNYTLAYLSSEVGQYSPPTGHTRSSGGARLAEIIVPLSVVGIGFVLVILFYVRRWQKRRRSAIKGHKVKRSDQLPLVPDESTFELWSRSATAIETPSARSRPAYAPEPTPNSEISDDSYFLRVPMD